MLYLGILNPGIYLNMHEADWKHKVGVTLEVMLFMFFFLRVLINARLVLKEIFLLFSYFHDSTSGDNMFDFLHICIYDYLYCLPLWMQIWVRLFLHAHRLSKSDQMPINQITILLWHGLVHQAPLSMGFPRQEYWSGFPFPFPRGSSWPRGQTHVCIDRWILYHFENREGPLYYILPPIALLRSNF